MALTNYQQAYKFGERDDSIYIKLMQCYFELGNKSKAIEMILPLIKRQQPLSVNNRYHSIVELAKEEINRNKSSSLINRR